MISVVIPSYNRAQLLVNAVNSVLAQSHAADEIIVVDDGSNDNTERLIASHFPQVRFTRQQHAGVSAARNTGIKLARGDWIAFLDSDDQWLGEKLAQQRRAIQRQPDSVLCHSDEIWIRNGKRVNPMNKHRKYGGDIFEHCLPLCCISPSATLVRRDVLFELGLFDETLPACEDYDLWLRLCAKYPVTYVDQPLLYKYGGHPDQLSKKHWGMDRFRIRALAKLLGSAQLDEHKRRSSLKMFEKKCQILEKGAQKHQNHALIREINALRESCRVLNRARS